MCNVYYYARVVDEKLKAVVTDSTRQSSRIFAKTVNNLLKTCCSSPYGID